MTPFHPKLRRALLEDKKNKAAGLTPESLDAYEAMLVQYFYAANYSPTKYRSECDELYNSIVKFQADHLPNLAAISAKWLRNQKKIVLSNFGGLELHHKIIKRLLFIGLNFIRVVTGSFRKHQQPGEAGTTHQNEQK